jgi:hypothetical protein
MGLGTTEEGCTRALWLLSGGKSVEFKPQNSARVGTRFIGWNSEKREAMSPVGSTRSEAIRVEAGPEQVRATSN